MKFLFSVIALFAMVFPLRAQTKTTDLYELIRSALVDSTSPSDVADWQKGISINTAVKWDKNSPIKNNATDYFKTGSSKILLPNGKSDGISVELRGKNLRGYSEISINISLIEDHNLEKLLGKKNYLSTLLKKEGEGYPILDHKVKFPGKKDVWMMLFPLMPGTLMPEEETTLTVIILFDYKEYKSRSSS